MIRPDLEAIRAKWPESRLVNSDAREDVTTLLAYVEELERAIDGERRFHLDTMTQRTAAERERDEARSQYQSAHCHRLSLTSEVAAVKQLLEQAESERDEAKRDADVWKRSCKALRENAWGEHSRFIDKMERELNDVYDQLRDLRRFSRPWEGDAYCRGAEAMREACAVKVVEWLDHRWATAIWLAQLIRKLPIPEAKP